MGLKLCCRRLCICDTSGRETPVTVVLEARPINDDGSGVVLARKAIAALVAWARRAVGLTGLSGLSHCLSSSQVGWSCRHRPLKPGSTTLELNLGIFTRVEFNYKDYL